MKNTKRSLITSLVTLLLCSAMFVGSSFAWFTDTVSNTGNKIQAGTLKIGLEQFKKTTEKPNGDWFDISGSGKPVFNSGEEIALWEPGYSQYAVLKLSNNGNLAFKYKMLLKVNGTLELNEEGHSIADAIDVYGFVADSEDDAKAAYGKESFAEFIEDTSATNLGSLSSFLFDEDGAAYGVLLPKDATPVHEDYEVVENAYAVLCLHMKEEAGNEYQGMALGTTFDIVVNATQYTYEKDGFNSNQYDLDADGNPDHPEFDVSSAPVTKVVKVLPVTVEEAMEGTKATIKTETPVETEGMKVTYPVGTVISDTTLPTSTETTDAVQGFEYKSDQLPTGSTIKVQDSKKVANYELTLPVSQDNQVLVAVEKFVGAGLANLELYHGNNKLATVPLGNEEYFIYNETSGIVTIYVKHASPIVFVYGQNIFHIYPTSNYKSNDTVTIVKAEDNKTVVAEGLRLYEILDGVNKLVTDGDLIYIHEGTYAANTCVYIKDSISIIGVGVVEICKTQNVSQSNVHLIDVNAVGVAKTVNVYLENLILNVNHKDSPTYANNCLISFYAHVYAKNITFKNASGGGVDLNCTNIDNVKEDLTTQVVLDGCRFIDNWDWKEEESGITDIKIDMNKGKSPNATACVKLINTNLQSKMFVEYNDKEIDRTIWKVYNNGVDISSEFVNDGYKDIYSVE